MVRLDPSNKIRLRAQRGAHPARLQFALRGQQEALTLRGRLAISCPRGEDLSPQGTPLTFPGAWVWGLWVPQYRGTRSRGRGIQDGTQPSPEPSTWLKAIPHP